MTVNGTFKVKKLQLWTGGAFKISYQMINYFSGHLLGISFTICGYESFHDRTFSAFSKDPIINCSVSNILKCSRLLC